MIACICVRIERSSLINNEPKRKKRERKKKKIDVCNQYGNVTEKSHTKTNKNEKKRRLMFCTGHLPCLFALLLVKSGESCAC